MNNKNQQISTKMRRAIPTILAEKNISNGCKKAGIDRATFYKWMSIPVFKADFYNHSKQIFELSMYDLKSSTLEAVNTILKLLNAKNESVRLRAAVSILEYLSKFIELEEITNRVDRIERLLENKKRGN